MMKKSNEKSNEKDIPRNNERLNIKRKYNRDIKDTLQTINKKGFMSNVKLNFRNAHVAYYGKTIRPRNKNDPGLITVAEATGINTTDITRHLAVISQIVEVKLINLFIKKIKK